jgi:hypothetical protein
MLLLLVLRNGNLWYWHDVAWHNLDDEFSANQSNGCTEMDAAYRAS